MALIPPLTHVLGSMVEVVGTTKFAGAALDTLTAFSADMAIAIGAGVPDRHPRARLWPFSRVAGGQDELLQHRAGDFGDLPAAP